MKRQTRAGLHAAVIALATILFLGCSDKVDTSLNPDGTRNSGGGGSIGGDQSGWLIPVNEVFDGGPGKDGIPALLNPPMILPAEATYLKEFDLVIGLKVGSDIRAYPHAILDWHEIINDQIGGKPYAITYCPLTGTSIGWGRMLNGQETTFGVSGLLFDTNLMPYDRLTNSTWSQMRLQSVNGSLIGQFAETTPMVETTWKTWKSLYPQTRVVGTNTGFSRPYGTFPYIRGGSDYRDDNGFLLFPVANDDTRLPRKDRVLGLVVGEMSKVYKISDFPASVGTINDTFNGLPVVAVGSNGDNFGMVFSRRLSDSTLLTFSPLTGSFPAVMADNEGTKWDLFGRALDGARVGTQLFHPESYIAYWFAWGAFHPDAIINGL